MDERFASNKKSKRNIDGFTLKSSVDSTMVQGFPNGRQKLIKLVNWAHKFDMEKFRKTLNRQNNN